MSIGFRAELTAEERVLFTRRHGHERRVYGHAPTCCYHAPAWLRNWYASLVGAVHIPLHLSNKRGNVTREAAVQA